VIEFRRLALCLLAFAPAPAGAQNWGGAFGWTCGGGFAVDGYQAGMWRTYGIDDPDAPYQIQAHAADADAGSHNMTWTISPRTEGPPQVRSRGFLMGRREAEAFREGPDYVHIDFSWHTSVAGPIWAHYWGDGTYAGADMLMTRWDVRRWTDRQGLLGGLSGGLSSRPLLTALAPARRWTVVAVDATGKQLHSESFEMPSWRAVETEYRRMRATIDRVELRFRTAHDPITEDGVACADIEDSAGSI
jgi:hypothetical protein